MEFTVSAVTNVAITVEDKECPICYDCVSNNINTTTTECGHCFHTSCLLKSCSINGFNCPMCRSNMVNNKKNATTTLEEDDDDELDTEADFIRALERSNALGEMFELMGLLMSHSRARDRLTRPIPTPVQPPINESRLPPFIEPRIPPINFGRWESINTENNDLFDDLFDRRNQEQDEIDNYVEDMIEQRNFGMENR